MSVSVCVACYVVVDDVSVCYDNAVAFLFSAYGYCIDIFLVILMCFFYAKIAIIADICLLYDAILPF